MTLRYRGAYVVVGVKFGFLYVTDIKDDGGILTSNTHQGALCADLYDWCRNKRRDATFGMMYPDATCIKSDLFRNAMP